MTINHLRSIDVHQVVREELARQIEREPRGFSKPDVARLARDMRNGMLDDTVSMVFVYDAARAVCAALSTPEPVSVLEIARCFVARSHETLTASEILSGQHDHWERIRAAAKCVRFTLDRLGFPDIATARPATSGSARLDDLIDAAKARGPMTAEEIATQRANWAAAEMHLDRKPDRED